MFRYNKYIFIILSLIMSLTFFVGCEDSSSTSSLSTGQSITLSDDAPVCSSKENVDKMISYVQNKNSSGEQEMLQRGEARILPKGTKVNITKTGIVVTIETENGEKWFAPKEAIK